MDLHPNLFSTPLQGSLIGLLNISEAPTRQQMFSDNWHSSFHFPLMLGFSHFGWICNKSVVPLQLSIGPVQCRIIDIRFHHSGLQIIQNHGSGDTPKEFEGPDVTIDPASDVLTKDKSNEPVTTVRKGHDEGPSSPRLPTQGIHHHPRITKINLGLSLMLSST
jgi:hypothetical protein